MNAQLENPLSPFERIYVINLRSRGDRRREMSAQLARIGLSFESPQVRLFNAVRPDDQGAFDGVGTRGAFMSHLGVLRDAAGLRNVLILEDDLNFNADFRLPQLPRDWSIFYGDARHAIVPTGALTSAAPSETLGCTHFVAFNGPVILQVTTFLEAILGRPAGHPAGGPMHVDGAYSRFREENESLKTFVATPGLGYQRPSRTDIHKLRWFDRTPVVRAAANLLRRLQHAART